MSFQILCVTMNRSDFDIINKMNINSDVIFANQSNVVGYEEITFDDHVAKMITTNTRGVGNNRNIALLYADADYCLLADDDCAYIDDLEKVLISEFDNHPDADIMIFHLDSSNPQRQLCKYSKTRKCFRFEKHPWGAVRIAFRLSAIRKANISFSALFGGGALYLSGEDSMFIDDAYRHGLTIYVSDKTIGSVSTEESTWFSGFNEEYYFSKGAFYKASYKRMAMLWMLYFSFRTAKMSELKWTDRISWMRKGCKSFLKLKSFEDVTKK